MSEGIEILKDLRVFTQGEEELIEIGLLKKGIVVARMSDYGKWQKIDFANQVAFVRNDGTKVIDKKFVNPPLYGNLLTLEDCDIYSDTKKDPVGKVLKNQEIPIVENINEDWYMTLLAGKHFYIKSKSVQKLS